ncbi:unnamed protein product [Paramecium sonneborni]|uniref:Uncharacterized protein n=1 Tax=Paramecium sonneborni TaxID=65129 RepID=A0A8S1JUW9_9CILI|nr:unnamed protein product [Paramecium sonneborni]
MSNKIEKYSKILNLINQQGCVTRTTCAAATIQAACVKNSSGGDCYWTGTACVDKTCANAPLTMTTNTACGGFVQDCITKTGGGCVANGACSAATLPAACVKNKDKVDYLCQRSNYKQHS